MSELVDIIRRSIKERDFYMLLDDRVKLIAGEDCTIEDADEHRNAIPDFAEAHPWFVEIGKNSLTFWSRIR